MKEHTEISGLDIHINSRDAIARIEELEDIIENAHSISDEHIKEEELANLKELEEQASCSPDWKAGEVLIREDAFADYARELAEEISEVRDFKAWPFWHIDWEAAADSLKNDYQEVNFNGETYYIRA